MSVLEGKDLAPRTIRGVISTISALFNFAMTPQRRWVRANPCHGIELPAIPEPAEIRYLTPRSTASSPTPNPATARNSTTRST